MHSLKSTVCKIRMDEVLPSLLIQIRTESGMRRMPMDSSGTIRGNSLMAAVFA